MERIFNGSDLNQKTIFDHPSGLFVLFFTEMWERFSYYGMRAILVLFLTSSIMNEGWGWERQDALELFAAYTSLVYLTPLLGGILADKLLGYRNAVVLGALIMALGHGSLALEGIEQNFFYLGLGLWSSAMDYLNLIFHLLLVNYIKLMIQEKMVHTQFFIWASMLVHFWVYFYVAI